MLREREERKTKYFAPQCEAALIRNPKKPFGDSIFKALNCPNQCSGNGQCQDLKGCVCDEHYEGHDCRFVRPT